MDWLLYALLMLVLVVIAMRLGARFLFRENGH
jgi:hypothetical protein